MLLNLFYVRHTGKAKWQRWFRAMGEWDIRFLQCYWSPDLHAVNTFYEWNLGATDAVRDSSLRITTKASMTQKSLSFEYRSVRGGMSCL
jgi:hypothetical protein